MSGLGGPALWLALRADQSLLRRLLDDRAYYSLTLSASTIAQQYAAS